MFWGGDLFIVFNEHVFDYLILMKVVIFALLALAVTAS